MTLLACALGCLAVVMVFGLMVTQDRSPLDDFDRWGRQAEGWADNHAALVSVLRVVEVTFATFGMIIWTTLVVVAVASRRRYRAAAFAIAVMVDGARSRPPASSCGSAGAAPSGRTAWTCSPPSPSRPVTRPRARRWPGS